MCSLYLTLAEFQVLLNRQSITLGEKKNNTKKHTNTKTKKKTEQIMPRFALFKRRFN